MESGGTSSEEKRLGQVVQAARKKAGLTQQALCQKTGLSYSTLAKIERGAIKAPSIFTIRTISIALGTTLDELLGELCGAVHESKKVSKSGVRFVYFDMNGCMVRFYNRAFTKLAEDSGKSSDIVETVFWQYNDAVCRGEKSVDELNTALAERLEIMVDWNRYYLEAVEPTPGIAELLSWASEHYNIGILTNTMPGIIEMMKERGILPPVHFDTVIDSSVVHTLKPEEKIFKIAAEWAGVPPQEILLMDDARQNLTAAGGLGWRTLWFDAYRPDESIMNVRSALEF